MDDGLPIRGVLLLALMGTGVASSAVGQNPPAFASPQAAAAAATSLWPHVRSTADLHEIRGGAATWEPRGTGAIVFTASGNATYSWVDIPAAGGAWDLRHRSSVEASITNIGPNPSEVQLWVVASHGWDSIADVATIAPGETRTFSCRLRECFPDGTPKLDPARVSGARMLVRKAAAGTVIRIDALAATGHAPPRERPADRVEVPGAENAAPAAGRRVRYRLAGDEGTDIACLLHLPEDWEPGRRYPVILEYPGNVFYVKGCYSTGLPDQCGIGFGMTRGRGAIWVSMPFIDRTTGTIAEHGWGNADDTADYCERIADEMSARFGGDRSNLVLTGFSRGAIACGFIGLRNDRIASLWKGFHLCQHFDGDGWNGATLEAAIERARRFRGRAVFHTDNPETVVRPVTEAMNASATFAESGLGAHAIAMFFDDRESTRRLRRWFAALVDDHDAGSQRPVPNP